MTASMSLSAFGDHPLQTALALAGLAAITIGVALALRRPVHRLRSLRTTLLVVALAAFGLAFLAAVVCARLMVLSAAELRVFTVVLLVAAGFAAVLVAVTARPLVDDVARLGAAARRVEQGDLAARTDVVRRDELGRTAHAFDEMVSRLAALEDDRRQLEAERRRLLTNIGHDLRTPLTALRVAVEALADGVAPDPDRYVASMRHDVTALSALVDDLFLLGRIEAGRLELDLVPLDVVEVVQEAAAALEPLWSARSVRVEVQASRSPAKVVGNPAALGRVVRNLLDNAVRHSPDGSEVEVSITAVAPGGEVVVHVRDHGAGFTPAYRAHAFESLHRGDDARTRAAGGAGLGLAITRGLVEAHGGRVWLGDGPGGDVAVALPAAT